MSEKKYVAYVGSYTHGSSRQGIHVYDVDVENGTLTERSSVEVSNASHMAVSKNGKYLYSIEDEGVAVFKRDKNGDLSRINSVNIDGMRGCFLSTDVDGKYLYVAGYHDGKVTVVHTHKDGRLGSLMDGVFHTGLGSVAERNFRPHVNCVRPTPDNKYLCAVDNGIAYILFELSNEIRAYKYDGSGKVPAFELIQTIETSAKKDVHDTHNAASGLSLANDGKHLFCTTAGEDTVSMFERDEETGMLTRKFTLPISGEYPKDLVLLPDDKHLVLANHASNTLTTFTVDYEKNIIVMNGKPIKITEPNCIRIWPVPEE